MTHIQYETYNFRADSLATIEQANDIISDYARGGDCLTLRQLYYQFVSRFQEFPNTERSYKNLGVLITKARMAGMISWRAIEDRNRSCNATWWPSGDVDSIIEGIEGSYSANFWVDQKYYIEVWVEKDALSDIIARPCRHFKIRYMACKGYLSSSAAWESGQRFEYQMGQGKDCVLIHLGDHDPSGMDMTRDNENRLNIFDAAGVDVRRIALNMDQIERYNPPPDPAKVSDPRSTGYIEEFGHVSWELDALEPKVLRQLITDEIEPLIDKEAWQKAQDDDDEQNEALAKLGNNWLDVKDFLNDL